MSAKVKKLLVAVAVAGLTLTACSSGDDPEEGATLVVGTTNFSETKIIANLYQQVLQANGIPAEIKELTTREVLIPALSQGDLDITPEYLGSLTEFLNKQANGTDAPQVATGDVDATFAAALGLAQAQNITLLEPSAAQDQNAFAVTSDFASANSLVTLSDLGTFSQGSPITLGGPPECPERPFCQQGLENVYGVSVANFVPLDASGPLTVQSLIQGTIQVGVVFSSSAVISANDFVVLTDNEELQTAENLLPAVHTPSLTDAVRAALDSVSQALTTEDLSALNVMVDVDRQDPADVATQFLQSKGLL